MKSTQKNCSKQKNQSSCLRRSGRLKNNVPNFNILHDSNTDIDTDAETKASTKSEYKANPGASSEMKFTKAKVCRAKCVFCGIITVSGTSRRHVQRKHLDKITSITNKDNQMKIKCMLCKEIVSTDSFQSHVIHYHPAPVGNDTNRSHFLKIEVGCLYCEITLGNQWYMNHLKDAHPEEADKMHKTGAKGQDKEKSVVDAMQTMNYEHRVKCAYCDETREMTLIEYNAHVQEYHPNYENMNTNSEKEIQEKAKQRQYLFIDRSKYLPAKPDPPEAYDCKSCGEKCDSMKSLHDHNKKMHDVTLCCNFCHKFFKNTAQRKNHEDEEHALMKYKCETCSKEFVRASSLKMHKKCVHLGITELSELLQKRTRKDVNALCNHCGKTFKRVTHLKWHVFRMHSDGNFQCDTCGKTFGSEHILKVHTNIHEKTRRGLTKYHDPLDNSQSDACKTQSSPYGETVNEKHPQGAYIATEMGTCLKTDSNVYRCSVQIEEPKCLGVVKDKMYACEYFGCDKRYHNKRNLRQHEREKHDRPKIIRKPGPTTKKRRNKDKIYACNVLGCEKHYSCTSNLRAHLRNIHGFPKIIRKSHPVKSGKQAKKTKAKSMSLLPISKDSSEPPDILVTINNPEKTSMSTEGTYDVNKDLKTELPPVRKDKLTSICRNK